MCVCVYVCVCVGLRFAVRSQTGAELQSCSQQQQFLTEVCAHTYTQTQTWLNTFALREVTSEDKMIFVWTHFFSLKYLMKKSLNRGWQNYRVLEITLSAFIVEKGMCVLGCVSECVALNVCEALKLSCLCARILAQFHFFPLLLILSLPHYKLLFGVGNERYLAWYLLKVCVHMCVYHMINCICMSKYWVCPCVYEWACVFNYVNEYVCVCVCVCVRAMWASLWHSSWQIEGTKLPKLPWGIHIVEGCLGHRSGMHRWVCVCVHPLARKHDGSGMTGKEHDSLRQKKRWIEIRDMKEWGDEEEDERTARKNRNIMCQL